MNQELTPKIASIILNLFSCFSTFLSSVFPLFLATKPGSPTGILQQGQGDCGSIPFLFPLFLLLWSSSCQGLPSDPDTPQHQQRWRPSVTPSAGGRWRWRCINGNTLRREREGALHTKCTHETHTHFLPCHFKVPIQCMHIHKTHKVNPLKGLWVIKQLKKALRHCKGGVDTPIYT